MTWKIEFDSDVEEDLRKLDATAQKRILTFLKKRIATTDDPRAHRKALTGDFSGLWHRVSVTIKLSRTPLIHLTLFKIG